MAANIHKGKDHALTVLSYFPAPFKELLSFRALEDHLSSASSFAIIVGYDDDTFFWSDIYNNDMASQVEAKAIVERFA